MDDTIVKIAIDALAILIPALIAIGIELLRRKLGLEKTAKIQAELATKKELATLAVKMVEELYGAGAGEKKLVEASAWLSKQLASKGIKVDATEIEGLINSALREIKDQLGESWGPVKSNK